MFCHCPARRYTDTHDGEVLRHMRPTLSELGEYDGTALMEFKTKKEIIYLLNHLNVCTYEMDDTPPFLVNQEAIDVAVILNALRALRGGTERAPGPPPGARSRCGTRIRRPGSCRRTGSRPSAR